jgi:hypothetical protein
MFGSGLLSRRDFLYLSGMALGGFLTPAMMRPQHGLRDLQGRVIYHRIEVYDRPSFDSNVQKQFWIDSIIPITEVTIGDVEPEYNRIWYQIGSEGYAHSGGIQPVRTIINQPEFNVPSGGQLAEVTVPYTDARWNAGEGERVAYRFYYETTHWVIGLVFAEDDTPWYQILDDKWELILYTPAQHIRLIPDLELKTLSPEVPPEAKRLEVRTAKQVVIAYEWDNPVFMAKTATGAEFSNGKFYTPTGRHKTFHKRPSRHMAAGNLARNGYDLPGIPWVSYITESGIAFHGTYWHNDYGRPRSHGCINLTSQAAKWIFRWTLPSVPPDEQRAYDEFATRVDVI